VKFILMYKPPCGLWYVHSHKLYDTEDQGRDAARRFLSPGTEYKLVPIDVEALDESSCLV
jgi:hypothetical protein